VIHQTPRPALGRGRVALIPLLLGLLVLAIIVSAAVGAVMLPLPRVVRVLLQPAGSSGEATDATIVWEIRFGRVLLAALIGAGLAVSGTALQGLFRNPLLIPLSSGHLVGLPWERHWLLSRGLGLCLWQRSLAHFSLSLRLTVLPRSGEWCQRRRCSWLGQPCIPS
jgi:iron complex transport system permease protein